MIEKLREIDEVIVKVWDMAQAVTTDRPVVREATLEWARKELRQLYPKSPDNPGGFEPFASFSQTYDDLNVTGTACRQVLPPFANEDEERAFWATHDSVDFLEGTEQVNLEPSVKHKDFKGKLLKDPNVRKEYEALREVEQVERNVRTILWRYFREELTPEAADDIAKEILSCHPDLALIDRVICSSLKWVKQCSKVDMNCSYWDCARGIKTGESYYYEDFDSDLDGQELYCIECAAFFMSQRLLGVIPLREAIREVKG